jgi:hypothetical protein
MSESVPVYNVDVKKRPLCYDHRPPECDECLNIVVGILTDGEHIYEIHSMSPKELAKLNESAQEVTNGSMWWEFRSGILGSGDRDHV